MNSDERLIIDVSLVDRLIAVQFPQWQNLPIRAIVNDGWDNRTFRLGDNMLVRMPSAVNYAVQVEKEQYWLPKLAPFLPLPIPKPLALGQPGEGYPWQWSIYRWLEGEPGTSAQVNNWHDFAMNLARFLGPNGHSFFASFSEREDRSPSIMWAFSQRVEKLDATKQELFNDCLRIMETENWHPSLVKLVKSTQPYGILEPWVVRTTRFGEFRAPMDPSGQITLLGDAVHAMPPDRGIGGSNVFEDARVLTSLLAAEKGKNNLSKLIGEYEHSMLIRAKKEVETSDKAAKIHHLKNFWSILLRNLALKFIGTITSLIAK